MVWEAQVSLPIEQVAQTMEVMAGHQSRLHLTPPVVRLGTVEALPVLGFVDLEILNKTVAGLIQAMALTPGTVPILALLSFGYPISSRPQSPQVHRLSPILVGTSGTPSQVPARFRSR